MLVLGIGSITKEVNIISSTYKVGKDLKPALKSIFLKTKIKMNMFFILLMTLGPAVTKSFPWLYFLDFPSGNKIYIPQRLKFHILEHNKD